MTDLNKLVNKIGNLVHESVPISNTEDDNKILRTWGEKKDIKVIILLLGHIKKTWIITSS